MSLVSYSEFFLVLRSCKNVIQYSCYWKDTFSDQLEPELVQEDGEYSPDDQSAWAVIPPNWMCLLFNEWVCIVMANEEL